MNDERPATKYLTREQILAIPLRHVTVDVPELGGEVSVWEMTGSDRDAFDRESYLLDKEGRRPSENWRARILVRSLRTPEGERLFGDDDAELLGAVSARALERLYLEVTRLSEVSARAADGQA